MFFLKIVTLPRLKFFSNTDCPYPSIVGDGYCNDEANNADCNYDSGDCCQLNVKTDNCSACICYHHEMCVADMHPLVGDGFCHDETNNEVCNYDGGDCCGSCLNKDLCSICECISGEITDDVRNAHVNDGNCNDENNNAICNYDGGDCCRSPSFWTPNYHYVNTDHCSDCVCFTTGVITTPGFPRNYLPFLRFYWRIEVPSNQNIVINFISFDLDTGGQQAANWDCL